MPSVRLRAIDNSLSASACSYQPAFLRSIRLTYSGYFVAVVLGDGQARRATDRSVDVHAVITYYRRSWFMARAALCDLYVAIWSGAGHVRFITAAQCHRAGTR